MYIRKTIAVSTILISLCFLGSKALSKEAQDIATKIPSEEETLVCFGPMDDGMPPMHLFGPPPEPVPPNFPPTNSYFPIMTAILSSNVELTDQQIETIHDLRDTLIEKSEPAAISLLIKQHELSKLLTRKQIDKIEIKQVQQEINDDTTALSNLLADHILSCIEVLTPNQRQIVKMESLRRELEFFGRGFQCLHRAEPNSTSSTLQPPKNRE